MPQFPQALEATKALLTAVGESQWADWVSSDLVEWRESRGVAHHLSAYGGMGSFNDILICAANAHGVTPAQEPWADSLFQHLKSVCYALARNLGCDLDGQALLSSFGSAESLLNGSRCLACGYRETTVSQLESLLASRHLPRVVTQRILEGTLQEVVAEVLELRVPGVEGDRQRIRRLCDASGVPIVQRSSWMRPCPRCESEDTAVYRWQTNGCLTPSPDNRPLKTGAA
jgi:hypothetical protein